MTMFGIGFPELIIIMVVALLVVGPSKLPELAKSLGKTFQEFRRMADDVKESFEEEIADNRSSPGVQPENQEEARKESDETNFNQEQTDTINNTSSGAKGEG